MKIYAEYKIHRSKTQKRASKMHKEILTIEEAAKLLQISRRSLYKIVREGEIPGRKVLNKWRFERAALKGWLNEGKKGGYEG